MPDRSSAAIPTAAMSQHGFVASLNGVHDERRRRAGVEHRSACRPRMPATIRSRSRSTSSHGTLTLGTESGVTEVGLGTADVTLTGSQSAIDAALAAGLTYTPTLNYHYADVLAVERRRQGPQRLWRGSNHDAGCRHRHHAGRHDRCRHHHCFRASSADTDRVRGQQRHSRLGRSVRASPEKLPEYWH